MKTQTEATETTKHKTVVGVKALGRKAKSKSKRSASSFKKATKELPNSFTGYSQQARDFFDRGKRALYAASNWTGATAKHLPETARKLNLPDQKTAMEFAEQRPLVVGAVGLGLGLVVGAMLPRMQSAPTPKRRK